MIQGIYAKFKEPKVPTQPATFFDPAKTFDDNLDHGPYLSEEVQNKSSIRKELNYKFLGHKLSSPFGIASGPLPTSKHVIGAFNRGFDVVCYNNVV